MVIFASEMSKKIFPTDITSILAFVVFTFGIVTWAEPVLGVVASNTVGKLSPPFVDSRIFTLAQFTGAPLLRATFQVIVLLLPALIVTGLLPNVTLNGPDVLSTVTTI